MSRLSSGTGVIGAQYGLGSTIPDFNSETYRVLRDDWPHLGVTAFAQEMFSVLQLLQDYNTNGTATYTQQPGSTPLTILQPFNIPANTPAIIIKNVDQNGVPQSTTTIGPNGVETNGQPSGGGGNAFPGTVLSGSGSVYQVRIIVDDSTTQVVTVNQMTIDSSETIPAGTTCIVVKAGTKWYMQVPVWL